MERPDDETAMMCVSGQRAPAHAVVLQASQGRHLKAAGQVDKTSTTDTLNPVM